MTAPHRFRPDVVGEPGYRPRCTTCGRERHPNPVPAPRRAAQQTTDRNQPEEKRDE